VDHCYFCAGNERHTPDASATVLGPDGNWQVRVVPNKYPAVTLAANGSGAFGVHEVIIESPRHDLGWIELDIEQLAAILQTFRDRLVHWARHARLTHAVVFKNSGCTAGASLEHVHSQLVVLPYIATAVQPELAAVRAHHAASGGCIFCDFVERELKARERIVMHAAGYVAVCAYAPRQPFETWILPERHMPRFGLLDDHTFAGQAAVLHELLRRLEAASPGAAYNLLLHTAPFDAPEEAFHWHWELVPRLTHEAGLEWGGGVYITPLSPENAAKKLRAAI
jgi:UDPglucose--hexose-1-phosphate uridylyltransferase